MSKREEFPEYPEVYTYTPNANSHLRDLCVTKEDYDTLRQFAEGVARELKLADMRIQAFKDMHDLDKARELGHAMLSAPKETFRWHAEKLAIHVGCSGPFTEGDAALQSREEGK